MGAWWSRRRPPAPAAPTDDLLLTEDLLRRTVSDVFAVRERYVQGPVVSFTGELTVAPATALGVLAPRFRAFGYTPVLRREGDGVSLQAWPAPPPERPGRVRINVLLFLLTCLTTLMAGSGALPFVTFNPFTEPGRLLAGVPFAFTLLAILGTHEFGHYFAARYHDASVSLPYFIPAPPPFLFGTLGAIIRMRAPARDRNCLLDIAAAGPLAGLAVAVPALILGLSWSVVGTVPPGDHLVFGDSLLMQLLVYLTFGPLPPGMDVFVHPVALAGWVGLFVTALNLFPVGQLDGGRIAYALLGERHRALGWTAFAALLALGVITRAVNWFVWAALLYFLVGFRHGPPLDDLTPLSRGRRVTGWACLLLLVALVPPVPVKLG